MKSVEKRVRRHIQLFLIISILIWKAKWWSWWWLTQDTISWHLSSVLRWLKIQINISNIIKLDSWTSIRRSRWKIICHNRCLGYSIWSTQTNGNIYFHDTCSSIAMRWLSIRIDVDISSRYWSFRIIIGRCSFKTFISTLFGSLWTCRISSFIWWLNKFW